MVHGQAPQFPAVRASTVSSRDEREPSCWLDTIAFRAPFRRPAALFSRRLPVTVGLSPPR